MTTLIIIAYIVSSVISYGATFAYFQRKFPSIAEEFYREDMGFAIAMALLPFSIVLSFVMSGFYKHGFKFK